MATTRHENQSVILVANEAANSVSIIEADTYIRRAEMKVGEHPHEVVSSPSGRFALVSNYGTLNGRYPGRTLSYIDIEKQSVERTIALPPKSRPHGIAFLSEDQALVTAEGIQTLYEVNVKNGDINKIIPLPGKGVHMVVVDAERQFAYVTNPESGTACRVDLRDSTRVDEIDIGDACEGIMLASDGRRLYITSRKDNTVSVVSTASFKVLQKINTARGPVRIAEYDHGKSAVVTNCISGNAQTIDLSTYEITATFKTFTERSKVNGWFFGKLLPVPISIVVRDDQQSAYVTHLYAGKIALVDLKAGKVLHEFESSLGPDGLSVSKIRI